MFGSGIAPSTACTLWASLGAQNNQNAEYNSYVPLPELPVLPAGYQIQMVIQNAGDQISGIQVLLGATADGGAGSNGFVLPPGIPLPLHTRSGIFCTATSPQATRVSVAAFSFAEA